MAPEATGLPFSRIDSSDVLNISIWSQFFRTQIHRQKRCQVKDVEKEIAYLVNPLAAGDILLRGSAVSEKEELTIKYRISSVLSRKQTFHYLSRFFSARLYIQLSKNVARKQHNSYYKFVIKFTSWSDPVHSHFSPTLECSCRAKARVSRPTENVRIIENYKRNSVKRMWFQDNALQNRLKTYLDGVLHHGSHCTADESDEDKDTNHLSFSSL